MFKTILVPMYFSNLVFFFNCFPITPFINTTLYLGNIASLLGISVLMILNPAVLYVYFNSVPMSKEGFNAVIIAMHVAPLYLFRGRQTLSATFEPDVIAALAATLFAYFLALNRYIPKLYGVSAETFGQMAVFMFFMFLGVHVLFFWK